MSQYDPTLSKNAAPLSIAGAGVQGPVLAGFAARITFALGEGEVLLSAAVEHDDGSTTTLATVQGTQCRTADVAFGTDLLSSAAGRRSVISWTTNRGTTRRQLWVCDLPTVGALYVCNQEAQAGEAIVYAEPGGADPKAGVVSLTFDVLPTFADQFFTQQEFSDNRYANTRRNWGGAATAEVWIDGAVAIAETDIHKLHSLNWTPGALGLHSCVVRLRAAEDSDYTVDIWGKIRVRQIPVPIAVGASTTISITYRPAAEETADGKLVIHPEVGLDSIEIPIAARAVSADVLPLTPSPDALSFGDVQIGGTGSTQNLTLTNPSGAPVTVISATIEGDAGFSITTDPAGATLEQWQTATYGILFQPASSAVALATLTVVTTAGELPISLVGRGVADPSKILTVSPALIDFGQLVVGQEQTVVVTITNVGATGFHVDNQTVRVEAGSPGEFEVDV